MYRHHTRIVFVAYAAYAANIVIVVVMPVLRVYEINTLVIEDEGYATVFNRVRIGIGSFVIMKDVILNAFQMFD